MTPAQCRAARALIDMKQSDLAMAAGVSVATIGNFERARCEVSGFMIADICAALKRRGIRFSENGVRLRKPASPAVAIKDLRETSDT